MGLKLTGKPTTERLENANSFEAMCTHRVRLTKVEEVAQELVAG